MRDPETYERFERVIVVHGVRYIEDLAYDELLAEDLPNDEILGELIHGRLFYYPVVSREDIPQSGPADHVDRQRPTHVGSRPRALDPEHDRAMICGSPSMLDDTAKLLDDRGFTVSPHIGKPGEYVIERAFVAK